MSISVHASSAGPLHEKRGATDHTTLHRLYFGVDIRFLQGKYRLLPFRPGRQVRSGRRRAARLRAAPPTPLVFPGERSGFYWVTSACLVVAIRDADAAAPAQTEIITRTGVINPPRDELLGVYVAAIRHGCAAGVAMSTCAGPAAVIVVRLLLGVGGTNSDRGPPTNAGLAVVTAPEVVAALGLDPDHRAAIAVRFRPGLAESGVALAGVEFSSPAVTRSGRPAGFWPAPIEPDQFHRHAARYKTARSQFQQKGEPYHDDRKSRYRCPGLGPPVQQTVRTASGALGGSRIAALGPAALGSVQRGRSPGRISIP